MDTPRAVYNRYRSGCGAVYIGVCGMYNIVTLHVVPTISVVQCSTSVLQSDAVTT